MNTTCEVQELTEDYFAQYEDEWQDCLIHSSADPIFSSWAWCFSWWKTWSELYSLTPLILVVFSHDKLIGITPLYYKKVVRKLGPSGYQVQVMGNAWRIGPSVRSEYTNFIIRKGFEHQVNQALSQHLESLDWDDFVICDHQPRLLDFLRKLGVMLTIRSKDRGVYLDVTGRFDDWITSLGKNTRLKVFNRRNYLKDRLVVEEIPQGDVSAREDFFDLLCKLHLDRRQEQPTELELNFHKFLAEIAGNHLRPVYSILKVDDRIVSAVYDIVGGGRRYNLQSVFIENVDKKVSLGMLHLGFAVQQAFEDTNVHIYDFLAGSGKKSFYKERFLGSVGQEYELMTSQVSKTNVHKIYLKAHMLARKIFSNVKKVFKQQ